MGDACVAPTENLSAGAARRLKPFWTDLSGKARMFVRPAVCPPHGTHAETMGIWCGRRRRRPYDGRCDNPT